MVADSIRRLLPEIMNEVLVRTIANSGVLAEARPAQRTKPAYPYVPDNGGRKIVDKKKASTRPSALAELLDEQAGAEFYVDPREAMRQHTQEEFEVPLEEAPPVRRLQNLNPALQHLAEDVQFDPGEMWGEDEHDSSVVRAPMGPSLESAAQAVGIDFGRMSRVIKETAPKIARVSADDAHAKAQYEENRIKRMRDNLDRKA